jgi:nucleotidyltransferase substrate binding protein (TIGR01987 family)
MEKATYKFKRLNLAYERLEEALSLEFPTPETRNDAVIRRFEFAAESLWEFLKTRLDCEAHITVTTPPEIIRDSRATGIFPADKRWSAVIRDRIVAARVYNDKTSAEICSRVEDEYLAMFEDFIRNYATLRLLPKKDRQYLSSVKSGM